MRKPSPRIPSAATAGRLAAIAVICLALGTYNRGDAFLQPRPQPDQRPSTTSDDRDFQARRAAQRLLFFAEREQRRLLAAAKLELQGGKTIAGLRHLQRLLDLKADRFAVTGRRGLQGIRQQAEGLLDRLTPAQRRTYERLFNPAAAKLVEQSVRTGDDESLRTVLRRYRQTSSGFATAHRLAVAAFDRGDYGEAVGYWDAVMELSAHRERITPSMQLRVAVALRRIGERRRSDFLMRAIGSRQFRIGGRTMTAQQYFEREFLANESNRPDRLIVNANALSPATPPYTKPLWESRYAETAAPAHRAAIEWRSSQLELGRTLRHVGEPVVVGRQIVLRDFSGLRAIDPKSGRRLWRYETKSSLANRLKTDAAGSSQQPSEHAAQFIRNELLTALSSDGRRLFLLDEFDFPSPPPVRRRRFRAFGKVSPRSEPHNRLVALALRDGREPKVLWSIGGKESVRSKTNPFAGHFFPGPALPVLGRLFVASEYKGTTYLACLRSADGSVVWLQPMTTPDAGYEPAGPRHRAMHLAYARGTILCPARSGYLIAVDAVTGGLRWASPFRDIEIDDTIGYPFGRPSDDHNGFVQRPVVFEDRLLYLPPETGPLQCFDVKTGRRVWQRPRGEMLGIGVVDSHGVVVVGRRRVAGLSLQTGKPRWSTPIATPSGRGLATREHYLLPTKDGRVTGIHRRTGKVIGLSHPGLVGESSSRSWQPGNLVALNETVLSVEFDRIRAFPQAGPLLNRLAKPPPRDMPARQTLAEVSLLLARTQQADELLSGVLKAAPRGDSERHLQVRAGRLMRELLFRRLKEGTGDTSAIISRLESLKGDPDFRARFLMAKADWQLKRGRVSDVFDTMDRFAALRSDRLYPAPDEPERLVSFAAWSRELLPRLERVDRAALNRIVAERKQAAFRSKGIAGLERFLAQFGSTPTAADARLELARRLVRRRDDQRAELLLLQCRKSNDRRVAARSMALLARLWTSHGLHEQAAGEIAELKGRYASVLLSDGRTTGRQFAESIVRNRLTATVARRLAGPKDSVKRVEIASGDEIKADPQRRRLFSNYRQMFPVATESPFSLFDLGDGADTELVVVDNNTGSDVGRIAIPTRHSISAMAGYGQVGRYWSLGSFGKMHGISLLQRKSGKPFWETTPFGWNGRADMPRVGPATAQYAVFQAHDLLVAVDPGTGRILWQRSDITRDSGLLADPYGGMFGDERALVLLSGDDATAKQFTVFDPMTGQRLHMGRMPLIDDPMRVNVGRFLLHAAIVNGKRRLRIWDPLANRLLLDVPTRGRATMAEVDERRRLLLTENGELNIIDIPTGRLKTLHQFDAREIAGVTYIKTHLQDGRVFVNLQRPVRVGDRFFSFYLGDALLPVEHIRGELYAFDLNSSRKLWKRSFPQRSILKLRHGRLPFLVLGSRIRDRRRGTRTGLLIEAVDIATGETLGHSDTLFPDRLLRMVYDPPTKAIIIDGMRTTIRLKMHRHPLTGDAEGTGL